MNFVAAAVVALWAAAAPGPRPVALVGRIPVLGTEQAWRATIRAPRSPVVTATAGGRLLRFRVKRSAPRRYSAVIRLPAPGRWALAATVGRTRYRLGSVRVITRPYRLAVPSQLVANPDGSLLVAERGVRYQVTRIDPATGLVSTFATLPVEPYGLAWDGDRLLVTTHAGIYAVGSRGRPKLLNTADVGPIVAAGATAFYGNETQIGRVDLASGVTTPLPTPVSNPHTLALAPDGRLLVADTGNGRVLAVDTATGASTVVASGLATPIPMALGPGGEILVGEHDSGRLLRVAAGGATSVLASGLSKPYAIALARDGDFYVTEVGDLSTATGRLLRITPAGRVSEVRLRR
jgi:sugar lactone lactonase YvrE